MSDKVKALGTLLAKLQGLGEDWFVGTRGYVHRCGDCRLTETAWGNRSCPGCGPTDPVGRGSNAGGDEGIRAFGRAPAL